MKNLQSNNKMTGERADEIEFKHEGVMIESHPVSTCEKVKEFRGNLIASVAHDLRTPLQSIIGYSETMISKQQDFSPEEQKDYLNVVLKSANKLSSMIEQFFEYSKLEVSEVTPQKAPFSPDRIIQDLRQNYDLITSEKNIKLNIVSEENLPLVYGDYSLIYRVFQNIVDNALKFTREHGNVEIKINKDIRNLLRVQISDTGEGIPAEELDSIFNKFQTTKENAIGNGLNDGMGLGLAIVRKILSLHNAEVFVKSDLGVGTTFTFYLPLAD